MGTWDKWMIHIQGGWERALHFIHLLSADCIIYFRNFSFNIFGLQVKPGVMGDSCISNSLLLGLCPPLPQGNISQSWPSKNSVLPGFLWHSLDSPNILPFLSLPLPNAHRPPSHYRSCVSPGLPQLLYTHSLLECFTVLPITLLLCLRRLWASCTFNCLVEVSAWDGREGGVW